MNTTHNRTLSVRTLHILRFASLTLPAFGFAMLTVSLVSHLAYDVIVGALFSSVGSVIATLTIIATHNAIADEYASERRAHPSYPYGRK